MLRSLYSGVAGLKTHQQKMDVIGNNIANVNTYAFKGSRVTFKDVYYQTNASASDAGDNVGGTNTSQIGYGSMVGTIDVLHTRSGFTPTGNAMDVYIDGEGYLITQDEAGNELLTRVGTLDFDGAGNLVDKNGRYVMGYPIKRDAAGEIVYKTNTPVAGKANGGGLLFDFGTENGAKLNDYNIVYTTSTTPPAGQLPNTPHATINGKTITVNLDGTTGNPIPTQTVAAPLVETALDALFTALNLTTNPPPIPPAIPVPGVIYYDKNFPIIDLATTATFTNVATPPGTTPMDFTQKATIAGGVNKFTNEPELDLTGEPRKVTKPGTTSRPNADGVNTFEENDVVKLTSIAIGSDGIIRGTTNGTVIQLGQILLAAVPNPGAMSMEGNSYFKAGANTGKVEYRSPGDKAVGGIKSGGLEMSNVDLSTEFADMITTQRGFQANSRIITVGDEMLQELVSMKR